MNGLLGVTKAIYRFSSQQPRVWVPLFVLMVGCVMVAPAGAAEKAAEEATNKSSVATITAYMLVVLGIIMGILSVCRPDRRAAQPEALEMSVEEQMRHISGE